MVQWVGGYVREGLAQTMTNKFGCALATCESEATFCKQATVQKSLTFLIVWHATYVAGNTNIHMCVCLNGSSRLSAKNRACLRISCLIVSGAICMCVCVCVCLMFLCGSHTMSSKTVTQAAECAAHFRAH